MQIVKSYVVVTESGAKDFNKLVNENLKNGWQPLGGVSTSVVQVGTTLSMQFSQAMIK